MPSHLNYLHTHTHRCLHADDEDGSPSSGCPFRPALLLTHTSSLCLTLLFAVRFTDFVFCPFLWLYSLVFLHCNCELHTDLVQITCLWLVLQTRVCTYELEFSASSIVMCFPIISDFNYRCADKPIGTLNSNLATFRSRKWSSHSITVNLSKATWLLFWPGFFMFTDESAEFAASHCLVGIAKMNTASVNTTPATRGRWNRTHTITV